MDDQKEYMTCPICETGKIIKGECTSCQAYETYDGEIRPWHCPSDQDEYDQACGECFHCRLYSDDPTKEY